MNLFGQTDHLIDKATIKVEVRADGLLGLTESRHTLHALFLDELQEGIFLLATFLLGQLSGQPLQLHGTGIAHGIHGVADTIDKSCLVVGLLSEHLVEVAVYLFGIGPIGNGLLEMMEHVDHLDVGTTVQRTFQRADTGCDARIGVGEGR